MKGSGGLGHYSSYWACTHGVPNHGTGLCYN
jgi:hypothetical protein